MIYTQEEINFIYANKKIIQGILEKKYDDIVTSALYEKDSVKREVKLEWARECKELINVLPRWNPKIEKKGKSTGI